MKSYSERGEDLIVMQQVALPERGFYADIGCAYPFLYSNTAFLRDRGWDGVNIDGDGRYAENWKHVAQFTHCVVGDGSNKGFNTDSAPDLSRFDLNAPEVPTRRLDDLLEYCPHIDFLSIDIEGAEYDALQTFDWKKNKPVAIIAEYATWTPDGVKLDLRVRDMLLDMGYKVIGENEANIIYAL